MSFTGKVILTLLLNAAAVLLVEKLLDVTRTG